MLKSYIINVSERKMFLTSDVSFGKLIITVIKSLTKSTDVNNFYSILEQNITFEKIVDVKLTGTQDVPTLKKYAAINVFYKQKLISYADDKYSFVFSKNGVNHLSLRANTNGYLKMWAGEFKGNGEVLNNLIESYFSGICNNDKDEPEIKRGSSDADKINASILTARNAAASNLVIAVKSQIDLSQNDEVTKIHVDAPIKETFIPKSEVSAELMNSLIAENLLPEASAS